FRRVLFRSRSGIGLCVTLLLSFLKRLAIGLGTLFHLREDVITSAVDNAKYRFRLFYGKAFSQRTDDGNTAPDASLEPKLATAFRDRCPDFLAESREHRLVGGNNRFTFLKGA